jgi:hypothetical protein
MGLESLENRQLLSGVAKAFRPPAVGAERMLRINGTPADDRITLAHLVQNGHDEIKVTVNKQRWYFATADISAIEISAGDGDDIVQSADEGVPLDTPLLVEGGDGADTLTGSLGDDTIYGGGGDDVITGGTGDDSVFGGDDDDTVYGGKGDDALAGGSGDDALFDDRGTNTYDGGKGRNKIKRGVTGPPEFVIGIWGQPSNYAWRWQARGVNTMVAADLYGGRVPLKHWDDEVAGLGMYAIRAPAADPKDDVGRENLLAWLANDEPDVHKTDPKVTSAAYERLKKIDPDRPVFMNFSGGHVVGYQDRNWKHPYPQWVEGGDWISNDIYPVAGWNLPNRLGLVGEAIDRLRAVDPSKPQFAFIEVSDQGLAWNLSAPGPTPDQVRAEIWDAVIHGARGITYFADQFKPSFSYNAMTPDVEAEMIRQNALLKSLNGPLLAPLSPRGYKVEVPAGMEATLRQFKGKTYVIVLNFKSKHRDNLKIKLTGVDDGTAQVHGENRSVQITSGQITDDFEGYTPHIYVIG